MRETHHEKRMTEVSKSTLHEEIMTFYRGYIEQKKDARILDLGAGNGQVATSLACLPR